ncbi:C-type lectin domain family 10 member A-like isoform X2 [Chanodichthys erythropterus]|uniref:C-type lectin domain family 10 member A-like isoform X2 n=1 Tax=Chanodichthys erythropterus TaxID=933992 RepID=UPI00351E66B4
MSHYRNVSIPGKHEMDRDDEEEMNIYADPINSFDVRTEPSDTKRHQTLHHTGGWVYYQSSFYFISSESKSWTESRRYCTERGADLIIIHNREEQDFVKNISGAAVVWIGLADSHVENRWKWVDGSILTSGFWASGEPNGGRAENCAVTVAVPKLPEWPGLVGWIDEPCNRAYQWICEKNISQLILP